MQVRQMDLITTGESTEFVREIIKKRGFIRAKYFSWDEPRNGLVTYASRNMLKVLFLTGVNMAASYYKIKISEIEAGLWKIIYTPDFDTFYYVKGDEGEDEDDWDLPTAVRKLFEEGS